MDGEAQREMTLIEWCERLPEFHAVNRQLKVLSHCRENPLAWWWWDVRRKVTPFVGWKSPIR